MTSTGPAPAPGAHRVIFIDLGRFLALVFMLYGHTVSALLAPEYQQGAWFDVWQFQRGLTSSLFLLLAGFAFSIATSRHWRSHLHVSPAFLRRARRFAFFVLLGYALHFPVARFVLLPTASAEQWRSFLAVDVLQLIGVTFLGVQALVLLTRSRGVFTVVALGLSILMVGASHRVWVAAAGSGLPAWMIAYLTPGTGSLFPLFPWAAYVLFGSALGQLYVAWGAAHLTRYATRALLVPGAVMASVAWVMLSREGAPWSQDPWNFMPIQVPMRVGSCLMILAGVAFASQRLTRLPHLFAAVAQETLPIYFVHLCIVYGSVWNPGLLQAFGPTLGPLATVTCVVVLLASMAGLGWTWHWVKHAHPRAALWAKGVAGAVLVGRLL